MDMSTGAAAYLDHSLVDAEVGVGLEVDAVVLLQRSRRPYPRCRGLPGGGGESRAAAPEGGVAVEVRRQHGEMVRRAERRERLEWRFLSGIGTCSLGSPLSSPLRLRGPGVRLAAPKAELFDSLCLAAGVVFRKPAFRLRN